MNASGIEMNSADEIETEPADVAAGLSSLLDNVVTNRLKRKAKDVLVASFEFALAVVLIVLALEDNDDDSTDDETDEGGSTTTTTTTSGDMADAAIALVVVVIVYVVALAVTTTFYAYRLPKNVKTSKKVEEAYAWTNNVPLVDGFLEIPLTFRFGASKLAMARWAIYFMVLAWLIAVLDIFFNWQSETVGIVLAVFTFYRVTADVNEFFVHHRHSDRISGRNTIIVHDLRRPRSDRCYGP